jgi:transposase
MNDHTHIAQITRQYLHDVGIQMLRWPPMSSELNPIEHLWDNLSRSIRQNYSEFHTVVQLEQALLHEWEMMRLGFCVLITNMPRRLRAVIEARGGNIRY